MKPPGISVDQYLTEEARVGAWESEGALTISGEAALEKLAAFCTGAWYGRGLGHDLRFGARCEGENVVSS